MFVGCAHRCIHESVGACVPSRLDAKVNLLSQKILTSLLEDVARDVLDTANVSFLFQ